MDIATLLAKLGPDTFQFMLGFIGIGLVLGIPAGWTVRWMLKG